jgi:hypothetical protein
MPARIPPVTTISAPDDAKPVLEGIKRAIGMIPNLYATLAHSPAALKGYLALSEALQAGKLSAREAGLTDGEILEVVAHVAARALTNAAAILAETEIDFPKAPRLPSN